ncbi:arsenate reductase/protein-tyrosine-phosphatase family protein [Duganella margarita]|nr:polysaccharide deacetylase family protein [Duganella margarita]
MRVCITIDTEFSIAGAFADPARRPVGAPMVRCDVDGRSQGLGFLLDCFRRHGVQATFFVETAQRYYFRSDPMRALAQQIAAAGHEVQLHVHPCWSVFQYPDWPQRVRRQPRQDDLAGRDPASTLALLRHGQATFADWGLPPPQVFRAGNLQYDDNLFRALAAARIPYSSNIGLGVYNAGLPWYQLYAGRHLRHGVLECPVLSYRDRRAHLKSVAVSSTSFGEMRALLDQAYAAGMEMVVILTHPFEYVQSEGAGFVRLRRHALNQARMERLCAYLAAHAQRFQACGLAAAASQPLTAASSHNAPMKGWAWRTAGRIAAQIAYDGYGRWAIRFGQRPHGTWRGAVRAWLARLELRTGRLAAFHLQHPHQVRRVVFVCLGNICRSAYAERVAEGLGMHAASIGLAACTGVPPPESALQAAERSGEELSAHRATDFRDFEVQAGDLFVAMEVRHAHELQRRLIAHRDIQIALLGLWCYPPTPHLHDPYTLSDAYFDQCFARLRQAVQGLHRTLARSGA